MYRNLTKARDLGLMTDATERFFQISKITIFKSDCVLAVTTVDIASKSAICYTTWALYWGNTKPVLSQYRANARQNSEIG